MNNLRARPVSVCTLPLLTLHLIQFVHRNFHFLVGVVSYVAAVAVGILQSGVMLQASRQLWRPSSALLSSRIGRRTFLGISCSSSNFLLHSSGEPTCISRIIIPLYSGWAQERPSAVPWIIRCLFFLHIFMGLFFNFNLFDLIYLSILSITSQTNGFLISTFDSTLIQ